MFADVTLPSGKIAKVKTELTGRDLRAIRGAFLNSTGINSTGGGKASVSTSLRAATEEAEDVAFGLIVQELEGSTDNLLQRILDLAAADYEALKQAVEKVQKGFFSQGGSNSSGTSTPAS